ncbi:small lysine-rich protein 1 [Anoplophora glabripennis]|uniref:small lysine-rich protein 1 n=1 Tax=Anoplophora glabripennis TaxID=217634 RepID=UPI000875A897|nr:small lysine-rich protein 1 [Anoplophora glabripennis]
MAGKGKKKKPKNNKNGDKGKKKAGKPKKTGGRKGRSKSARCTVDIFTEAAMENAYTTCHNVQDLLRWRGFPWPDAQKKKKKGKK